MKKKNLEKQQTKRMRKASGQQQQQNEKSDPVFDLLHLKTEMNENRSPFYRRRTLVWLEGNRILGREFSSGNHFYDILNVAEMPTKFLGTLTEHESGEWKRLRISLEQ